MGHLDRGEIVHPGLICGRLSYAGGMGSLRGLLWLHTVTGVALAFGGVSLALLFDSERLAVGTLVIGILWLLGYGQLRRRAGGFDEEVRQQPEATLPWLPRSAGILQVAGGVWTLITPWGGILVVTDLALILAVMIYVLGCHGMEVRVDTRYWGLILAILGFGILGVFAALLFSILH